GAAGVTLSQPLVVKVTAADGTPVAGVAVDFTVSSGQATLNPASATTDANGSAQTQVTLGSSSGAVEITATVRQTLIKAIAMATGPAAALNSTGGVQFASALTAGRTVAALSPQRQLDLQLRNLERSVLAPRMASARAAMRQRGALRAAAPPTVGQVLRFNTSQ